MSEFITNQLDSFLSERRFLEHDCAGAILKWKPSARVCDFIVKSKVGV